MLSETEHSISGDSTSTLQAQEPPTAARPTPPTQSEGAPSQPQSQSTSARSSLALPTLPSLPNLDDLPRIEAPGGSPLSSDPSSGHHDWHDDSSYSFGSISEGDSYAGVQGLGIEIGLGLPLSAAEILAKRRPSLPILSLSSASSSSSPSTGGSSSMSPSFGFRGNPRLANALGPRNMKGMPLSFDPGRRGSVDANLGRLGGHPYAQQAQYTSRHSGQAFTGGLYSVGPSPVLARRAYSQAHVGLGLTSEDADANGRQPLVRGTYFITPASAHSQSQNENASTSTQGEQTQNRPMLTQRMSMPSFHPESHQHRLQQQLQQSGPPNMHPQTATSAATNGSAYAAALGGGGGLGMFTNPFQQSTPPATTATTSSSPPTSGYDTPISPLALPSAAVGGNGMSRRYARHGLPHHPDLDGMANYAISFRSVPAPVPGPLPDATFSFGVPPSTSSSSPASGSPGGGAHMNGKAGGPRVVEEEGDDASAVSSTYDPLSRFGSLASVADSESSWTSAYWSDAGQSSGRKLSAADAQQQGGYDVEARRPSM